MFEQDWKQISVKLIGYKFLSIVKKKQKQKKPIFYHLLEYVIVLKREIWNVSNISCHFFDRTTRKLTETTTLM